MEKEMRIGIVHDEIIHCPYCGQDIKVAVMPPDFFGEEELLWFLEEHTCLTGKAFYRGDKVI